MNSVNLIGRLTRDPDLRSLSSGTSVCQLGLAVNERYKDRDGVWQERVNFFDVTVWGRQGESCAEYLGKGRQVGISGRLRFESWEKDGEKRSKVTVVADRVEFLSDGQRREEREDAPIDRSGLPPADDPIPF